MPKLSAHQSAQTTKTLLIGDSGSGKSGCLASLAADNYNLRIIDLDNGIDILKSVILGTEATPSIYPKNTIERVDYETVIDGRKNVNGKLLPGKATAWQRVTGLLSGDDKSPWKDFGSIATWTSNEVLVVDGLSRLTDAARDFNQTMNARLGQKVTWDDIYATQQSLETFFQTLYDDAVKCQVVVIAHPDYIKDQDGIERGYPQTIGNKLSPRIGQYFNNVIEARSSGNGANKKRKLLTRGSGLIEVKTSAPGAVKAEYSIEKGLAEFFRDLKEGWAPEGVVKS